MPSFLPEHTIPDTEHFMDTETSKEKKRKNNMIDFNSKSTCLGLFREHLYLHFCIVVKRFFTQ